MAGMKLHGSSANVTGYQLGDCLGRGAFGSVYRGLNWTTGETVAVKQIQLGNIPKSELGEIMSEIDLLKNLKHPNIVKYKGSEKTREYLYIILEYCENGSLQHICKRFGKFPEGLVGVYISQVLSGLIYLHDQGVIHRDIKGANILTTKDGAVKLADFGVATRTGAMSEGTVVGSPYWMAPEVIDQSGATTASDVWSVGCVVIELLEGKPPYSWLEPMPALFRIVQDDYPPLPEGASPIVKDFLLHCFQKDFNLRVSAKKLSRHPWMVSARKQLDAMKGGGSMRSNNPSKTSIPSLGDGTAYDEAVKSVQEWNEALKEPTPRPLNSNQGNHYGRGSGVGDPSKVGGNYQGLQQAGNNLPAPTISNRKISSGLETSNQNFNSFGSNSKTVKQLRTPTRKGVTGSGRDRVSSRSFLPNSSILESKEEGSPSTSSSSHSKVSQKEENFNLASFQGPDSPQTSFSIPIPHSNPNPNVSNGNLNLPIVTGRAAPATSLIDQTKALAEAQGQEENDNDNWDDDFEDGIDTLKIAQLEKGSEEKETDGKKKKREDEGKRGTKDKNLGSKRSGEERVRNAGAIQGETEKERSLKQDSRSKKTTEEENRSSQFGSGTFKAKGLGSSGGGLSFLQQNLMGSVASRNGGSLSEMKSTPNLNLSLSGDKNRMIGEWDEGDGEENDNDNGRTIRPIKSTSSPIRESMEEKPQERPAVVSSSKELAPVPTISAPSTTKPIDSNSISSSSSNSTSKSSQPIVEDYSDLVSDEEESHLDERVQKLRFQNSIGRRLFHPNDLKAMASGASSFSSSSSSASSSTTINPTTSSKESANLTPQKPLLHQRGSSSPGTPSLSTSNHLTQNSSPTSSTFRERPLSPSANLISPPGSRNNSFKLEIEKSNLKLNQTRKSLGKYSEGKEEDWSDVFGSDEAGIDEPIETPTLQLTTRLSNRSWLGDADADEDDPFAEIDEEEFGDEADLEANVARDKHARMCSHIVELVEALKPSAPEEELNEACEQLDAILTDMPEMKAQVLSSHGALAIIQLLEVTRLRDVSCRLLGLLNLIIYEDPGAQENLCLIGAIPVVMSFTAKKFPHEVRLEAAHFVFAMCSTSSLTLQFVLSCRGLKTLVELIDEDYNEQKDLVWLGVACVNSVLELQSPASRNDFCRMLAQEGLLEPLSTALISVVQDSEDEYAESAKDHILQTFLIYSQSDSWLKKKVATRGVLRRMLQSCPLLEPQSLTLMLKVIKNLSMSPVILDELQNCNTIEILTRTLADHHEGEHGTEMSNQILTAMYNLCRLNKSRQEEAAQAGIIPQLLRVARTNSPLKQFALPILCDFAHAGKPTRKMFWQHSGLSFYLKLLEDPYWQVSALESILVWLQDETARVEDVLLRSTSIDSLLYVFTTAKANSFENLLEPFLKICRLSTGITTGMAKFSSFFKRLIDRLTHPKAVVRLNLLKIAKLVCDVHPERQGLIEHYGLFKIIDELSQKDAAILVRELAREILNQRYMQPEPPMARAVRRTTSESNVSMAASSSLGDGARTPPSVPSPTRKSTLPPNPLLGERDKSNLNPNSSFSTSISSSSSGSVTPSNPSISNTVQQNHTLRRSPSRSMFTAPPRRPTRTRDFSDS